MESATKETIKQIKFNYQNIAYDFSKKLKVIHNIIGYLNNLYIVEQHNNKFIVKFSKGLNKSKFQALLSCNKQAATNNITLDYIYGQNIKPHNSEQELYCLVKPYINHHRISFKDINNLYVEKSAAILSKLHHIDTNTDKTDNTESKTYNIKDLITLELTDLGLDDTRIKKINNNLSFSIANLEQISNNNNIQQLCHIDPVIDNFLFTSNNTYLIDFEYANICDYSGVIWDLCYFIVSNKLSKRQENLFLNRYIESNNKSTINIDSTNLQSIINTFKKDVVLYNKYWYEFILEQNKFNPEQKDRLVNNLKYFNDLSNKFI